MNDEADAGRPSKSQRKRDHAALQALADSLAALPEARLRRLPLGERSREELMLLRRMPAGGARNRQVRLLAQLLLEEDIAALQAEPRAVAEKARRETARHHAAERLRDRLLQEGESALEGLGAPEADRLRARTLLAEAARPAGGPGATAARRELYRLAMSLVGESS